MLRRERAQGNRRAELEHAQNQKADHRLQTEHGRIEKQKRDAQHKREQLAEQDIAHALVRVLHDAEREIHGGKEHAGDERDAVADHLAGAELIEEEQHDAEKRDDRRDHVRAAELFVKEQGREEHDEQRRGILQGDGVGGGGELVRADEAEIEPRHQKAGKQRPPVDHKAQARHAHIGEDYAAGDQTAQTGQHEAVPRYELDENAGDAPKRRAQQHLEHGNILLTLRAHGDVVPSSSMNNRDVQCTSLFSFV